MRSSRVVFPTAAMVAVVVALAACGGAGQPRRDAVNQYFDRVDAAQSSLRRESGPIKQAFGSFSAAHNTRAEVLALRHARTEIAATRDKVRAIRAPDEARLLQRDLVTLFTLQADVAGELVEMSRFVPLYASTLAPLSAASTALSAEVRGAKAWKRIAAAFDRYRESLAAVVTRLDALAAPPTLRPGLNAERKAIRAGMAICVSIGVALAAHDGAATSNGIRKLSGLGASNVAITARQAQIGAARAYNARLEQIAFLTAKIAKGRERLVASLG